MESEGFLILMSVFGGLGQFFFQISTNIMVRSTRIHLSLVYGLHTVVFRVTPRSLDCVPNLVLSFWFHLFSVSSFLYNNHFYVNLKINKLTNREIDRLRNGPFKKGIFIKLWRDHVPLWSKSVPCRLMSFKLLVLDIKIVNP